MVIKFPQLRFKNWRSPFNGREVQELLANLAVPAVILELSVEIKLFDKKAQSRIYKRSLHNKKSFQGHFRLNLLQTPLFILINCRSSFTGNL